MGDIKIIVNEAEDSNDILKALTQIFKQLNKIEKTMATKAEVEAGFASLKESIANVKGDVLAQSKKIEDLTAVIADSVPDSVVAELNQIAADLAAVAAITPEEEVEQPEEPTDPSEEEPVEEEPVDETDPVDEEPIE